MLTISWVPRYWVHVMERVVPIAQFTAVLGAVTVTEAARIL